MDLFHIVDEGAAIIRLRGRRYRQVKVYRRGKDVYAAIGSDFVRLLAHGGTTDPHVGWLGVEGPWIKLKANRAPVFEP